MICCVVAGALVAALIGSARAERRQGGAPWMALVLGAAGGALVVGLTVSVLDALGVIDSHGPLLARLGFLLVPAGVGYVALLQGAGATMVRPACVTLAALGAFAGSLVAEALDLHLLALHTSNGGVAWVAVHLPLAVFLVLALIPRAPRVSCGCGSPLGGRGCRQVEERGQILVEGQDHG